MKGDLIDQVSREFNGSNMGAIAEQYQLSRQEVYQLLALGQQRKFRNDAVEKLTAYSVSTPAFFKDVHDVLRQAKACGLGLDLVLQMFDSARSNARGAA